MRILLGKRFRINTCGCLARHRTGGNYRMERSETPDSNGYIHALNNNEVLLYLVCCCVQPMKWSLDFPVLLHFNRMKMWYYCGVSFSGTLNVI